MDNNPPGPNNLFGSFSRSQASQLSPYLNVDPSYLQSSTPEYILTDEHKRGSFEKSFSAIGSAVIVGGGVGGVRGLFQGFTQTKGMTGRVRNTQIINYTVKSGGSIAKAFGTITVFYSLLHMIVTLQFEDEHPAKSIVCGGLTGGLYKSTAGIKKCGMGAAFGVGLASLWALVLRKDERVSNYL